jgi:hypothetical protein
LLARGVRQLGERVGDLRMFPSQLLLVNGHARR